MSAIQDAEKILEIFGDELSEDLKNSLNAALRSAGYSSPQEAALTFVPEFYDEPDGISMAIVASGRYWRYIEHGVSGKKSGSGTVGPEGKVYSYKNKMPPRDIFGEKWQKSKGIDARVVLLNIKAKAKSNNKLEYKNRKFTKTKKLLSYKTAVNSLSMIYQRSVYNKGLKPKPFIDRVLNDGRLDKLRNQLSTVLSQGFKLEITQ